MGPPCGASWGRFHSPDVVKDVGIVAQMKVSMMMNGKDVSKEQPSDLKGLQDFIYDERLSPGYSYGA